MNTSADPAPNRVPWGAVALFYALACGLAWLIQLPIWLGDGLASPMFYPLDRARAVGGAAHRCRIDRPPPASAPGAGPTTETRSGVTGLPDTTLRSGA